MEASAQSSRPITATAVSLHPECDNPVAHQSRIFEDVINRHTSSLTNTIGNNLTYLSNKFIELEFISREASDNILTKQGIGNVEKGSQFLGLIIANSRISYEQKQWFSEFVSVFSSEAAYTSLATTMTEDFKMNMPHSSSIPFTAQTDLPANEPQSVHTHSQGTVSDQVQSRTVVATSTVDNFIDYVKTVYRESDVERQTSVVKWPPTPSKVYINLVCIDHHCEW